MESTKLEIRIMGKGQYINHSIPVIVRGQKMMAEKSYSADTINDAISYLEEQLTARDYDKTFFIFDDVLHGDGKYSERIINTSLNRIKKIAAGLGIELGEMTNWNNQGVIWNHTYVVPVLA